MADEVAVLYAGRKVESARTKELLAAPCHPYTRGLLNSIPGNPKYRGAEPAGIHPRVGAQPASLGDGCPFENRCPLAQAHMPGAVPRGTGGIAHPFRLVPLRPGPGRRPLTRSAMDTLLEVARMWPCTSTPGRTSAQGRGRRVLRRAPGRDPRAWWANRAAASPPWARPCSGCTSPRRAAPCWTAPICSAWARPLKAVPAEDADDLPGPLLLAQPARSAAAIIEQPLVIHGIGSSGGTPDAGQ